MEIGSYINKHQPILKTIFSNAINNGKLSHAYLLVSERGIPSKEIAIFLAKSLVCDEPTPLACEKCITCLRVEEENYCDIVVIDGSDSSIKKNQVDNITDRFSHTAVEAKGKMIYVIHLVENMTIEAINALLKFLEEPGKETYAILTTENINKVLQTIISRSQTIRLQSVKKDEVIAEATAIGVAEEDAEILVTFYNNAELIKEEYEKKEYLTLKETMLEYLNSIIEDNIKSIYVMQNKVIPLCGKSKEDTRIFLDLLTVFFHDINNKQANSKILLNNYDTIITELANKLKHADQSLVDIMSARNQINLNLNVPLLLSKLAIAIVKED